MLPASGALSSIQSCHPGGAGGHEGSGCQCGGGTKPGGGGGQPGAGLKRRPKRPPSGLFRASHRIYIQNTTVGEHSSQNAMRCELLHGPIALRPGIYLRHTDVVKSVDRTGTLPDAKHGGDARDTCDVRAVPVSGTAGAVTSLGSERGTRARIARLILENGPVTAAALSTRLGLTPAAVRRH